MLGRHYLLLAIVLLWPASSFRAAAGQGGGQDIHQREQQKALERVFTPQAPDISLSAPPPASSALCFPIESPCQAIHRVILEGTDALPRWVRLRDLTEQARGRCLGVQGINRLMGALQNRLTDHGWITARVLAPPQDLRSGELRLLIFPGRIGDVRLSGDSSGYATLYNTVPAHKGALLDLRDIEQGLENLQRLPSVIAKVELLPGRHAGESDILISRRQERHWRLGAWLNDGGTRATGRYQSGVMLALDNPLSFSDLFYVTLGRDVGFAGKKHIKNYGIHYSVPWGYWLFSANGGHYHYSQSSDEIVSRVPQTRRYRGASENLSVQAKRVVHRGAGHKTSLSYDVMARTAGNAINNRPLKSQQRRTSTWRAGVAHRQYHGASTLDAELSYQQGTRWFGALPAQEERQGNGTALARISQWSALLNVPFTLADQRFHYIAHYRHQVSHTRLTPQDQFAIGNRWTVRGFDGERTLSADNGWYLRNDIAWRTPLPGRQLYLGVDYGELGGALHPFTPGKRLAGGVAGLRGVWAAARLNYDMFTGTPLSKPDGLKTDAVVFGFNLNWQH